MSTDRIRIRTRQGMYYVPRSIYDTGEYLGYRRLSDAMDQAERIAMQTQMERDAKDWAQHGFVED